MKELFIQYPEIFSSCKDVNSKINSSLNGVSINENEISIDHLMPFLFPEIPQNYKLDLAITLRIAREIIDIYNKGNQEVSALINLLRKYYPVTFVSFDEYKKLNDNYRYFKDNDILKSYLYSTKRVFYRNEILNYYSREFNFNLSDLFFNTINSISAFFLYDDDVCDFEKDINSNKKTILTDYILFNKGSLEYSNQLFVNELNNIENIYCKNPFVLLFVKSFKTLYQ